MNIPEELKYTSSHEWVREEDGAYYIGITDYAQSEMSDLVYVELPEVDDEVEAGERFGAVESVKAVADVNSPVTGRVAEINELLLDSPEEINENPYEAWMIRVEDVTEVDELMDYAAYEKFLLEEE